LAWGACGVGLFNPWVILAVVLAFAGIGYTGYVKGDKAATERISAYYSAKELVAEKAARVEEQRRTIEQKEADNAQTIRAKTIQVDRDNARDSVERLRKLIGESTTVPDLGQPITSVCPATNALRDILKLCTKEFAKMGEDADEARDAGLQCQAYYDSNITNKVRSYLGKTP